MAFADLRRSLPFDVTQTAPGFIEWETGTGASILCHPLHVPARIRFSE
jgi:hypothetical protein